jgi:hypothetical protein
VGRSLIEKPQGSNSMDTLLSQVNERTKIKFLTRLGEIRTLCRWKEVSGYRRSGGVSNKHGGAIAHCARRRRKKTTGSGEVTKAGGHVGRGAGVHEPFGGLGASRWNASRG